MKNKVFKILSFILTTTLFIGGIGINAEVAPQRMQFTVEGEEYESFFADFLSNEAHKYRTYAFKSEVVGGDPSHFVPYLKAYGLPVLISIDSDGEQPLNSFSCTAIANLSSGALNDTELEYWCSVSESEGYHVRIFFHGDAEKDYYKSLSNKKRLKFLKRKFFKEDINQASIIKNKKDGDIKYETVNIGNEALPCRVIYMENSSGTFSIEAFFMIGNYCVGIQSFGESYDELFDALEKIRIDIMPYSELINNAK